jgi:hypothetical protein
MKKIIFHLGIVATTIVFSAIIFICSPSATGIFIAHGAADIAIAPAVIDDHGLPQDIFNYTLTVTNKSSVQKNIFASVYEITAGGNQPFIDPSLANRPASLADWITVSRGAITLQPGEAKKIPVGVTINPYATAGDYHAVIAFVEGSTRDEAERHLSGAPQALVNFAVASNKKEILKLASFTPDKRFSSGFPVSVGYTIKNTGDVPSTPSGLVLFYDRIGHEVGSVPANASNIIIAPGESHTFTADWNDAKAGMGQYQAALQVTYGANDAQLADTILFWILPWQKILIIFFVLLAVAIGCAMMFHRSYLARHHRRLRAIENLTKGRHVVDLRHPSAAPPPRPPQK